MGDDVLPWHLTSGSPQKSSLHSRHVLPPKPGLHEHWPVTYSINKKNIGNKIGQENKTTWLKQQLFFTSFLYYQLLLEKWIFSYSTVYSETSLLWWRAAIKHRNPNISSCACVCVNTCRFVCMSETELQKRRGDTIPKQLETIYQNKYANRPQWLDGSVTATHCCPAAFLSMGIVWKKSLLVPTL